MLCITSAGMGPLPGPRPTFLKPTSSKQLNTHFWYISGSHCSCICNSVDSFVIQVLLARQSSQILDLQQHSLVKNQTTPLDWGLDYDATAQGRVHPPALTLLVSISFQHMCMQHTQLAPSAGTPLPVWLLQEADSKSKIENYNSCK